MTFYFVYNIIALVAIILGIACLIIAFIVRIMKKRTLANIFELIASILFLIYTIKFTYLFGRPLSLTLGEWGLICLFLFSLLFAIYKVVFFIRYK